MKRILILELGSTGHRPRYIRYILESEACRNSDVVLAGTRELLEHAELRDLSDRFHPHEIVFTSEQEKAIGIASRPLDLLRRQLAVRGLFRQVFRQINAANSVDRVLIPYVDDCCYAITLLGSPFGQVPWVGINFQPKFHFHKVGILGPGRRSHNMMKWFFRRTLRQSSLKSLLTIDPTLFAFVNSEFPEGERKKLQFLPDPAVEYKLEPRAQARAALGIPAEARLLLVYGALSERKGVDPLIECVADPSCPNNVHVLIAGLQSPYLKSLLAKDSFASLLRENRLHMLDAYLNDHEEARILAASDCAWIGYQDFYGMSGILLLAARHGIPCIVSEPGITGYLMKKKRFGMLVNPNDKQTIAGALRWLAESPNLADAGARGREAFQQHSVLEFQKSLSNAL